MAICLDVLGMCRICLVEEHLVDILLLGETTSKWLSDINRYFDVQLTFHDDKSTKLCRSCIRKVENWRRDVQRASNCQNVINYLDRMVQKQSAEDRGNGTRRA